MPEETIDCAWVEDNIDAWALGALDAGEARAIERHIASCGNCTELAARARDAAAALALAVPLTSASETLKARVMASASVLSAPPHARPQPRRWLQASAATLVAAGIGVIAWGGYLQSQVGDLRDRNASIGVAATVQSGQFATMRTELVQASAATLNSSAAQDAVFDIVSQPDVRRTPLNGTASAPTASGRYVWSPTGDLGVFVASKLPSLEDGKSYCLWLVYDDAWVYGGLFNVDATGSGRLVVRDVGDVAAHARLRGFAVTIESSAGAKTHSAETVMQSRFN